MSDETNRPRNKLVASPYANPGFSETARVTVHTNHARAVFNEAYSNLALGIVRVLKAHPYAGSANILANKKGQQTLHLKLGDKKYTHPLEYQSTEAMRELLHMADNVNRSLHPRNHTAQLFNHDIGRARASFPDIDIGVGAYPR